MTLAGVLLVCITAAWIVERFCRMVERHPAFRLPVATPEPEPMPPDLYERATAARSGSSEMDGILHEQALAALREQYQELGSWDAVRQAQR